MLRYLSTHNSATLYGLAKETYGNGIKHNRGIRRQVQRLRQINGVIKTRRHSRRFTVTLTDGGRLLCQELGLASFSSGALLVVVGVYGLLFSTAVFG